MRNVIKLFSIFLLLIFFIPAYSNPANRDQLLRDAFAKSTKLIIHDRHNVDLIIDQKWAVEEAVLNKKLGLIQNPDITVTSILQNPVTESGTIVGLMNVKSLIYYIYSHTSAEDIHFKVYLLFINDYGQKEKHLIYSFKFTRSLYEKIDWHQFEFIKLIMVSPEFKFSDWYVDKTSREPAMHHQ